MTARPYSDQFAQSVIDGQVKEIDRLHSVIANSRRQRDELKAQLKSLMTAESCPNCPNQGWYEWRGLEHIQCEWCYLTANSLFNVRAVMNAEEKKK